MEGESKTFAYPGGSGQPAKRRFGWRGAAAGRGGAEAHHARNAQDDASEPTYVVDGIVHYCVANMPGAVARTSTFALNHATLPFTLALADKGWREALKEDPHLRAGLNVCDGKVTCEPVAAAHGLKFVSAESLLV